MFWKIKRKVEDETQYKHDEFNWVQLVLVALFVMMIVLVAYSNKKVDTYIQNDVKTNNPIIEGFKTDKDLKDAIKQYGDINNEFENMEN